MADSDEKPQGLGRDMVLIGHSEPSPPVRAVIEDINRKLVGQDHVAAEFAPALEFDLSKMREQVLNELFGVYVLIGPPGVGKNEFTRQFAINWIGDSPFDRHGKPILPYTQVDCTAFSDSHNVSKLSGGTPDYTGFEAETPLYQHRLDRYHRELLYTSYRDELKESIREQFGAKAIDGLLEDEEQRLAKMVKRHAPFKKVFVLDELPEGHPTLHDYVQTVLNGQPLEFSDGHVTDLTRTAVIITGNTGMDEIRKAQKGGLGFQTIRDTDPDVMNAKISAAAIKGYEKFFRPPFISRTRHGVIVFRFLGVKEFERILDLQLEDIAAMFSRAYQKTCPGVKIVFTPEAKTFLLESGVDIENGARRLKAIVRKEYLGSLARLMNWQEHAPGVEKLKENDTLVFEREGNGLVTYVQR